MKVAVVFWSGTGNTEMMASAVADGVKQAGGEAATFTAAEFSSDMVNEYDSIAFGCPAMCDETLEEGEFEPMFTSVESSLSGKKVGLFGSYGWGDGQWMRDWEQNVISDGAVMAAEPVICNDAPDDDAKNACIALGKALVG